MSDPRPLPSPRLDRAALERVLARAAELQSKRGETIEEFSEEQLLELGREVGLSPQHLRQAMAEERTRPVPQETEAGIAARLFGAGRGRASRPVPGTPRAVRPTIDAWMQREELLQVKRHFGDRMVWEPRRDFLGGMKRALNLGGRGYPLTRGDEVTAAVIPVDDDRSLVSLDADLSSQRGRVATEVAGATVVGASATGVLVAIGVVAAAAAAPLVLIPLTAVYGVRSMQDLQTRAQLALEQLLDRLERGDAARPPCFLGPPPPARPRGLPPPRPGARGDPRPP